MFPTPPFQLVGPLMVPFPDAAERDSVAAVFDEALRTMGDLGPLFDSVTDLASAKAAGKRFQILARKQVVLTTRLEKLPVPDAEARRRYQERMDSRAMEIERKHGDVPRVLARLDEEARAVFLGAFREFLAAIKASNRVARRYFRAD